MMSRVLKLSFVVGCICLLLCATPVFSQKRDTIPEDKSISLELKEKPLKLVAEEIFKQTGYKIVFNEKWNALPLSGQYTRVTLDEFFRRALRKQNVTLFYDEKSKVVNLLFFGDRGIGKIKAKTSGSENDASAQEFKVLHEQQRQDLQNYLKDPESVDPLSGKKLVDIQELHKAQQAEQELLLKDPEAIDPLTHMTNAEIKNIHDVQQQELKQLQNDSETIDPLTGMTKAEIKELHDVQHAELEQIKKNSVNEEPEKLKPKKR